LTEELKKLWAGTAADAGILVEEFRHRGVKEALARACGELEPPTLLKREEAPMPTDVVVTSWVEIDKHRVFVVPLLVFATDYERLDGDGNVSYGYLSADTSRVRRKRDGKLFIPARTHGGRVRFMAADCVVLEEA